MECEKRIVDSGAGMPKDIVSIQVCQANSAPFISSAVDILGDFMFSSLDYNRLNVTSILSDDKKIEIELKSTKISLENGSTMLFLLNMNAMFYDKTEDFVLASIFAKIDPSGKEIGNIDESSSLNGNFKMSNMTNL